MGQFESSVKLFSGPLLSRIPDVAPLCAEVLQADHVSSLFSYFIRSVTAAADRRRFTSSSWVRSPQPLVKSSKEWDEIKERIELNKQNSTFHHLPSPDMSFRFHIFIFFNVLVLKCSVLRVRAPMMPLVSFNVRWRRAVGRKHRKYRKSHLFRKVNWRMKVSECDWNVIETFTSVVNNSVITAI